MRPAVWLLALALVLAGCTPQQPDAASPAPSGVASPAAPTGLQPSEPFDVTAVRLLPPDGGEAVTVEVFDAYQPALRQRGLMERTQLPPGTGMVFRYPGDAAGGFWMKNTLIPLSIAYFDADGVVHTVLDMEPCESDPCPSYPPDAPYRGALEVNQGFFTEIGLEPGWRVELPSGLPTAEA